VALAIKKEEEKKKQQQMYARVRNCTSARPTYLSHEAHALLDIVELRLHCRLQAVQRIGSIKFRSVCVCVCVCVRVEREREREKVRV
jgi:hypothetical protein